MKTNTKGVKRQRTRVLLQRGGELSPGVLEPALSLHQQGQVHVRWQVARVQGKGTLVVGSDREG